MWIPSWKTLLHQTAHLRLWRISGVAVAAPLLATFGLMKITRPMFWKTAENRTGGFAGALTNVVNWRHSVIQVQIFLCCLWLCLYQVCVTFQVSLLCIYMYLSQCKSGPHNWKKSNSRNTICTNPFGNLSVIYKWIVSICNNKCTSCFCWLFIRVLSV